MDENRACSSASVRSGGHSMPIRILIADDDPAIRGLFRRLLEAQPNWQVCGEAVNGVDAVEQVKQVAPDLAILDLGMPLMNGIEAAREISQSNPALPMLLISVQEMSDQLVEAAKNAGFKGAVTKSRGREVVTGVEAVLQNELFFRRDELR
ncbi:MAG: hypothetical protein DMG82_15155 [Acidobacteria bacterium]|nr:MAG: hypothetical protein DMG82_15155 [Acidobacteriota bacterium]PYX43765.1 MAG: hypothetical protein DMG83_16310 [Acidobacteriota bacterium]